ncbi:polysaccharide pyruvyl transferase family protein [Cupriavidus sp. IDO]|uniref:polysaccharide pyruvyl transferase family protein n=1 Tax=Cupriavidus sp. IDO TaxID=1539142 RepID=UPI000689A895|nr:polysaccharide pyruvyl transferase family protein [Cupriavidus sp. IDO]KWR87757.1 chromosome condensation regulator RCC1 [Cupriavidus sp. IDO]
MKVPEKALRTADCPTILFGAFDRHNLGDLLLPHVIKRLIAPASLRYGGLRARNLTTLGGFRVHALTRLAASLGDTPVEIVHTGGEILTCNAWEAAVMLLPTARARAVVAQLDSRPAERVAWARELLGLQDCAPYLLAAGLFGNVRRVIYHAAGGIGLEQVEPAMRAEVVAKLGAATYVGVRDQQTRAALAASGIDARLEPDPAVMVAALFGDGIRRRSRHGEVAGLMSGFPHGYLAMQFSADFGDDETLAQLGAQLRRVARASKLGVVLFRAGAAPWHDDLDSYRRLAAKLSGTPVALFRSLNLWDICALIACSRGFAGSSLHGGIVAGAFAMPWVGLLRPGQAPAASKQAAFGMTWGTAGAPAAVAVQELAAGIEEAMATGPVRREALARELAEACRASFRAVHGG